MHAYGDCQLILTLLNYRGVQCKLYILFSDTQPQIKRYSEKNVVGAAVQTATKVEVQILNIS